jgi:flagellar protein FliO/FliZ
VRTEAMSKGDGRRPWRGSRLLVFFLAAFVCWHGTTTPLLRPAIAIAAQQGQKAAQKGMAVKAAGELQQSASLFLIMLKAVGALALVLGLIALIAFWLRKAGWGSNVHGRGGSLIKVLDTRMVAPKKYVAVLRIADEFVAVGITDQQINLLTRLEPNEDLTASPTARRAGVPTLGSFAAIFARARKSGNDDSFRS